MIDLELFGIALPLSIPSDDGAYLCRIPTTRKQFIGTRRGSKITAMMKVYDP
jgi:hypothetical protein